MKWPSIFTTAITGGIGSGKSTIAKGLESLGGRLLDADEIARQVTHSKEVMNEIVTLFGAQCRLPDGSLDRPAMAKIVFSDAKALKELNELIHPKVRAKINKELVYWNQKGFDESSPLQGNRPLVILDIPLLEQTPFQKQVNTILFVDASFEDRLQRVSKNRSWDESELRSRESCQLSLAEKKQLAAYVIENSNSKDGNGQTPQADLVPGDSANAQASPELTEDSPLFLKGTSFKWYKNSAEGIDQAKKASISTQEEFEAANLSDCLQKLIQHWDQSC